MSLRFVDVLNVHRRRYEDNTNAEDGVIETYISSVSNEEDDDDEESTKDVQELYMTQTLNHFDDEEKRTFEQRFFYSDRYVQPSSSSTMFRGAKEKEDAKTYAFLCVGGEGPAMTKHVLTDSVHCTGDMLVLAQRLFEEENAIVHVFGLEHRYYGKSYPEFPDQSSPVSNENLQYLSSRQALHDIANFIQHANKNYIGQTDSNPKWVTFGGSYPGMLSAWSRYKFPNLVHASVSSSSPVQAQLDFPEYKNHVAKDLAYDMIGGSDKCLEIVLKGHEEIATLLSQPKEKGGAERVAKMFNVCNGADPFYADVKNVNAFLGDGVIDVPAQENDPSCDNGSLCNIADICDVMTKEYSKSGSAVESLAFIASQQSGGQCTEVDWNGTLQYISSADAQAGGLRSWLWQTCNEFGFYQTCDENSLCPFGRGYHSIGEDLEICEVGFGVHAKDVKANVENSLEYYKGWDMDGSRILFVNGDVDPWAELSITGDRGSEEHPTVWVKEASHHFWTHMVKETDGEAIADARLVIQGQVMEWLEEEENNDNDGKKANKQGFVSNDLLEKAKVAQQA
eukprot:CAMPEP_0185729156 /NCGR_PEP_ID=MMETSP1171-20130828/4497_1 /TAXON_ID=374046 /ORGANISM="Helicotheca tamensis, Strain CCMP826" /LENGTH=564 /DNA_ID=CAMNT_0028397933 /DNA_START=242 /DNA_END=1936 /DNA_ORIENTATION=+